MSNQSVGTDPKHESQARRTRGANPTTDSLAWPMRARSRRTEMVECMPPTQRFRVVAAGSTWGLVEGFFIIVLIFYFFFQDYERHPRTISPHYQCTEQHAFSYQLFAEVHCFHIPYGSRVQMALADCTASPAATESLWVLRCFRNFKSLAV